MGGPLFVNPSLHCARYDAGEAHESYSWLPITPSLYEQSPGYNAGLTAATEPPQREYSAETPRAHGFERGATPR